MHQLDDLLAGTDGFDLQRPYGPLADSLDEPARDLETDIRLEQMAADFAQRVGHVAFREHPPTPEPVQYPGQLFGKGRKHKRSKLNCEYPFTRWGSYLGSYDGQDLRDAACNHPVDQSGPRRPGGPIESHESPRHCGSRCKGTSPSSRNPYP